jgi:hypothetical protein
MTATKGVDYSVARPAPGLLHLNGYRFAVRYLATNPAHPSAKSLTKAEYVSLVAAGVAVPVVFESYAQRALGGFAAGVADAKTATASLAAMGLIDVDRPVYFAIDFQPSNSTEFETVMAYIHGAASVRGAKRVGVYGSWAVVKGCLDRGLCAWAWQTRAWSRYNGVFRWDTRAHIRQTGSATVGGSSVDINYAYASDYGQFPKPKPLVVTPPPARKPVPVSPKPKPVPPKPVPPKPVSPKPVPRHAPNVHPVALRLGARNKDVTVYQTYLRAWAKDNGINVAVFMPHGVTGQYGHETALLTEACYSHIAHHTGDHAWLKGDTRTPGPRLLRMIGLGVG